MKKILLVIILFIIPFGCDEGYEDDFEDLTEEGLLESISDSEADSDTEDFTEEPIGNSRSSGFCGDYRYSVYTEQMNGKSYSEIHYTDSDDDSVVVCIDPDNSYGEAYYVTLYRNRTWWPDENCGTKVFTPSSAGADVEKTWDNTCVRSNDDYYVVIQQTNPWRRVYGDYGIMSY